MNKDELIMLLFAGFGRFEKRATEERSDSPEVGREIPGMETECQQEHRIRKFTDILPEPANEFTDEQPRDIK